MITTFVRTSLVRTTFIMAKFYSIRKTFFHFIRGTWVSRARELRLVKKLFKAFMGDLVQSKKATYTFDPLLLKCTTVILREKKAIVVEVFFWIANSKSLAGKQDKEMPR